MNCIKDLSQPEAGGRGWDLNSSIHKSWVEGCPLGRWANSQAILWRRVLCAVSDPALSSRGWMHKQGPLSGHRSHPSHPPGPFLLFRGHLRFFPDSILLGLMNIGLSGPTVCQAGEGVGRLSAHRYQACLAGAAVASAEPFTFTHV